MELKRKLLAVLTAGLLSLGSISLAFLGAPAPALAASGSCSNNATGHAIEMWFWNPPANGVPGNVTFDSVTSESFSIGPYPASVNQVDQNWQQIDDTAPILWFAKNVPGSYADINELFTSCQQWTLQAAQKMAAQGFSPTMIGGVMGPVIGPNGNVVPDPIASGGSGTGGATTKTITVNASPVNYYVNGKLATPPGGQFDNQGVVTVSDSFVFDKTTYVPIRFAAELLRQPVAWNGSQHGVDITANSTATAPPASTTVLRAPSRSNTIQITVDATPVRFYVGGSDRTPPGEIFNNQGVTTLDGFIYDKTTYVPIRLAAELLGQTIQWDRTRYSVDIGTPPTSENTGQTKTTTGAVASATALFYPPVVTNPPAGSATRAAKGIKRDDKLFAASGKGKTVSKTSPVRLIIEILVAAAVVVGAVLFIRWRRYRAMYDIRRYM
ncbi:MAG: stalk domain-containing protein [Thermaerobacter sp.]|nr:stalk domain-containing protein [Thermaerobacter sp.]